MLLKPSLISCLGKLRYFSTEGCKTLFIKDCGLGIGTKFIGAVLFHRLQ